MANVKSGCVSVIAAFTILLLGKIGIAGSPAFVGGSFGFGKDSKIADMVSRPDGAIVVCGLIDSQGGIPEAEKIHRLFSADRITGKRAFVAEFSSDLNAMNWISVFPADCLEPNRIALAGDGTIAIAGKHLGNLAALDRKKENWNKSTGAIAKLSRDGSQAPWVSPAGPNQGEVTGLAIDAKGRVFFTADSRVRQASNYILRKNGETGENEPWAEGKWCVYLHINQEPLKSEGQFLAFYEKTKQESENGFGFDYDGEGGWGPTQFSLKGFREGGQVLVLPGGDIIVSSCLQYDFRVNERGKAKPRLEEPKSELDSLLDLESEPKGDLLDKPETIAVKAKPPVVGTLKKGKSFPAFDYFLARYSAEGELRWSTNLYQAGDGVHTPDQKPLDLAYDENSDSIYALVHQHGSNRYRFKGELVGDTGNLMISWLGKIRAKDGGLEEGWYFQNNRLGKFGANGVPQSPPYPKLAGNALRRISIGEGGKIFLAGSAGAQMWTSPGAFQSWPEGQDGGSEGALLRLDEKLESVQLASCLFADAESAFVPRGLAVTSKGIYIGGSGSFSGELADKAKRANWAENGEEIGCFIMAILHKE